MERKFCFTENTTKVRKVVTPKENIQTKHTSDYLIARFQDVEKQ